MNDKWLIYWMLVEKYVRYVHADDEWMWLVDAYENAQFLCEEYYNAAPECTFHVRSRKCFSHS